MLSERAALSPEPRRRPWKKNAIEKASRARARRESATAGTILAAERRRGGAEWELGKMREEMLAGREESAAGEDGTEGGGVDGKDGKKGWGLEVEGYFGKEGEGGWTGGVVSGGKNGRWRARRGMDVVDETARVENSSRKRKKKEMAGIVKE